MSLFFRLFLFVLIFFEIESKIRFVIILNRHGARSPYKYYDERYFNVGKKQLTEKGKAQMYILGKYYQSKYFTNQKFLKTTFMGFLTPSMSKNIFIISSPIQRAIDSALLMLDGLLIDSKSITIKQIQQDFTNSFSLKMKQNFENNNIFPLYVQKPKSDYLFHGYKNPICPKAEKLINQSLIKNETVNDLNELRKTIFPSICLSINFIFNKSCNSSNMTYTDLEEYYDLVKSSEFNNIPIDFKINQTKMIEIKKERIFYRTNKKMVDKNLIKFGVSSMFKIWIQALNEKKMDMQKINGESLSKIIIFSGHDTIMILILQALLTKEEKIYLGLELGLEFGSHMEIELNENKQEYYIEIYLNDKKLSLNKCNKGNCKLDDFIILMNKWITYNHKNKCFE